MGCLLSMGAYYPDSTVLCYIHVLLDYILDVIVHQIFCQFLIFTCWGCGKEEAGTDEEKAALLSSNSDAYCNGNSGLPCLNTKNSVQQTQRRVALSRSGSGSPEPEVITTYYGLPKNR